MGYSGKVAVVICGVIVLILVLAAGNTVFERRVLTDGQSQVEELADALASHISGMIDQGRRALEAAGDPPADPCSAEARRALTRVEYDHPGVKRLAYANASGEPFCADERGRQVMRRLSALLPDETGPIEAVALSESSFRGVRLWRGAARADGSPSTTVVVGAGSILRSIVPVSVRRHGVLRIALSDGTVLSMLDRGRRLESSGATGGPDPEARQGRWLSAEVRPAGQPVVVELAMPASFYLAEAEQTQTTLNLVGVVVGLVILGLIVKILMRPPSPGADIAGALKNREFEPYYQPIVDLRRGELAGCEMLARRRLSDGTLVPPSQFIPLAEATGLAVPMTRALMQRCVADLGDLYRRNPRLKISINLFDEHFESLQLANDVQRIFDGSGIAFDQLVFEITERRPLQNLDRAHVIIRRLQELGAQVALDDAGTGHSGLAYLQQLGIDVLKIDKLFIDSITADGHAAPIVDMLADLGRRLGMTVVAEGVENFDQIRYLRAIGVDQAQGYAFAPPLSGYSFRELVRKAARQERDQPDEPAEDAAVAPRAA